MADVREYDQIIMGVPGFDPHRLAKGCAFDEEAADRALDFFPTYLRHVKGSKAGEPFDLAPWQASVIANLFGWKQSDGTRRFREGLIYVPRKNGKTAWAAGIVNYMLFCDGEPGAEIYSAAAEREQASLVFHHARGMVLAHPALAKRGSIYKTSKAIVYEEEMSSYKAIAAEEKSAHGFNIHCIVVDELHAMYGMDGFVDALVTGTGARRQPLILYLTTADFERISMCNEKLDYAKKVRDGVIDDPTFLPVIYEASREDDWKESATWHNANPNLGISLGLEYMEQRCRRAQEVPSFENTFKRLHLNIKTEQDIRWIQLERWDSCSGAVNESELAGAPCFVGIDLASTRDVTAVVAFFPDSLAVLPYFFVPKANVEDRERRDRVPYSTWANEGLIDLTEGNVTDYEHVRAKIRELAERFSVKEVAYDPWNAQDTANILSEEGLPMVKYPQTFSCMNEPTKRLEALVVSGQISHGGNKVLRWMASNAAVALDSSGNVKIDKKKSHEKVDGLVALVMAMGRWLSGGQGDQKSVYEDRGLIVIG